MSNELDELLKEHAKDLREEKANLQEQVKAIEALQRKIESIDRDLDRIRSLFPAKAKQNVAKKPRQRRTRKDRSDERAKLIRTVVDSGSRGTNRAELLVALNAHGDKQLETMYSNMLNQLQKTGEVVRVQTDPARRRSGRYYGPSFANQT